MGPANLPQIKFSFHVEKSMNILCIPLRIIPSEGHI